MNNAEIDLGDLESSPLLVNSHLFPTCWDNIMEDFYFFIIPIWLFDIQDMEDFFIIIPILPFDLHDDIPLPFEDIIDIMDIMLPPLPVFGQKRIA